MNRTIKILSSVVTVLVILTISGVAFAQGDAEAASKAVKDQGLAQNFGLQLVMAFPEDRLPTMIEHADTVVQCRVERTYDDATGSVSDIQNWVVRVDRDRLREAFA